MRLTVGRKMWLNEGGRLRRVVRVGLLRVLLLVRVRIGCIIGVHDSIVREGDWGRLATGAGGLAWAKGQQLLTV